MEWGTWPSADSTIQSVVGHLSTQPFNSPPWIHWASWAVGSLLLGLLFIFHCQIKNFNFNISYKSLYMPLARYSGVSNHKYVLPLRVSLLQALQEAGEMSGWAKKPCTALQLQKLETTSHRFPYIQPIFWHIFRYHFMFLIVHALQVQYSTGTISLLGCYNIYTQLSLLDPCYFSFQEPFKQVFQQKLN